MFFQTSGNVGKYKRSECRISVNLSFCDESPSVTVVCHDDTFSTSAYILLCHGNS